MYFKNKFRDFTRLDWQSFSRCNKLPDGKSPKICDSIQLHDAVNTDDTAVIVSGGDGNNTIISLVSGEYQWIITLPGCNRCHCVIADAIVDEFREFEDIKEAVDSIVSDFGLYKL